MFDGPDDARRVLETHFDASRVEAIVNALVPAVVFDPKLVEKPLCRYAATCRLAPSVTSIAKMTR